MRVLRTLLDLSHNGFFAADPFQRRLKPDVFFGRGFAPCRPSAILADMKVGEILKRLSKDGWYRVPSRGGHRQFKHPTKLGRVTVSGKFSDDLPPGTLNSILKQAGLKE